MYSLQLDADGPPVQIEFEYGFVLDVSEVEGVVEDSQAKEEVILPINLTDLLEMEPSVRSPTFPLQHDVRWDICRDHHK